MAVWGIPNGAGEMNRIPEKASSDGYCTTRCPSLQFQIAIERLQVLRDVKQHPVHNSIDIAKPLKKRSGASSLKRR